jgi:O-antigen ligase
MSTRTAPSIVSNLSVSAETARLWGLLGLAAVAAIAAGYASSILFAAFALLLVVVFAYVAYRSPRGMLTLLVLTPLVDRYLIRNLVAPHWQSEAQFLSEGLLVLVAAAIFVHARRAGRLLPAIRHPVTLFTSGFIVVAIIGALLNGVPPVVAGLGLLTTIDGLLVFFLARAIGLSERDGVVAMVAFTGIAVVAAVLALGQVILAPDILGLVTFNGRFNDGLRPGSFFTAQPNMLAAVLALPIPFTAFVAGESSVDRRSRVLAAAALFLLLLAFVYTFSRGTWLALAVALVVTGLVVNRRALAIGLIASVIAVATAFAAPRGLLLPVGSQWSIDVGNATLGRIEAISAGNDQRIKFIQNALPILIEHPIVGTGPGTYGGGIAARFGSPLYASYTSGTVPDDRTVDNYWLHLIVEFGIAGATLMVGLLGWLMLEIVRGARRATGMRRALLGGIAAAAVVSAIVSATEMLLEGNTTTFPLFFFLGVGTLLAARGVEVPDLEVAPMTEPAEGAPEPPADRAAAEVSPA